MYGLCPHNNIETYCPSCLSQKEKGRKTMYQQSGRQMGKYELIPGSGIWVPDIKELAAGAAAGATGSVASSLAQSGGVQAAAQSAAAESLGNKVINFYKNKPMVAIPLTLAVGAFLVYGVMSFAKRK